VNAFIDEHRARCGVEPICSALQVAPSAYRLHAARRRLPGLRPERAKRDALLLPEVQRVFDQNLQVYGADKVWRQLLARCFFMRAFDTALIRTARLVRRVRPLAEADVQALFEIHSDPRAMRYWSAPVWTHDERGRLMVSSDLDPSQTDHLRLGICLADSSALIGTCTFFGINAQCQRAELGYMLASRWWGRGYMHEALTAFIDHGLRQLGLNRIEADTDPRNERSMRLLERLHFVKEGHFRKRWMVDGEVSDSAMFGLLREDWRHGS
jgi:ribosomal-protein-alanine N-acetyltransferase